MSLVPPHPHSPSRVLVARTCGTGQVAPNVGLGNGGSSEGHRSSGQQKGKERRERRGNLLCLHPSGMDQEAEILLLGILLHLCLLVEGGFGPPPNPDELLRALFDPHATALQEHCCFYANKSGIVRDKIKRLQENLIKRRKELFDNPLWSELYGVLPYLLPLLGPLLGLLLIVSLGPFLFNKVMAFIKQQIDAIKMQSIQVHYHRLEMADREAHSSCESVSYDYARDGK
ncbi:uncharacterized protein WM277_001591 [Molossus nigricans]